MKKYLVLFFYDGDILAFYAPVNAESAAEAVIAGSAIWKRYEHNKKVVKIVQAFEMAENT